MVGDIEVATVLVLTAFLVSYALRRDQLRRQGRRLPRWPIIAAGIVVAATFITGAIIVPMAQGDVHTHVTHYSLP